MKKTGASEKIEKAAREKPEPFDFHHLDGVQLAAAFGVTRAAVTNWRRDGCPQNSDGTWFIKDVHDWLLEREKSRNKSSELEKTKLENQITIQKIEIAEKEKKVIPREKIEFVLANMYRSFKHYWTDRWQHNTPKMLKAMGLGADNVPALRRVMGALVKESMDTMLAEAKELRWENVNVPKSNS